MDKVAMYKEQIYKQAGVEYGYRAYKSNDPKLYDQLSKANLNDDWKKEDEVRAKLGGKHPWHYGYPDWSEKGLANTPYEHDHKGLIDHMNGVNTHKYTNFKPLIDPYSGENNHTHFLAGKDSAEKMVKMYDELLQKMPKDSTFDRVKYNEAVKQRDVLMKKIENQRQLNHADISKAYNELHLLQSKSDDTRKDLRHTFFLNIPKKHRLKTELHSIDKAVRNKATEVENAKNKGIDPKDLEAVRKHEHTMYSATDRDVIEQYKESLKNSIKDGNNMYEWGWS